MERILLNYIPREFDLREGTKVATKDSKGNFTVKETIFNWHYGNKATIWFNTDITKFSGMASDFRLIKNYRQFTIINWDILHSVHMCEDENKKLWKLDLTCDASFPEIEKSKKYNTPETHKEFMFSLIGKVFECESIDPYIPLYFVRNGFFITPPDSTTP